MDELRQCRLQLNAARKIIEKYADQINSFEVKSIPELKAFIAPQDQAIKSVAEKLKQEFERKSGKAYSPEFQPILSLAAFHFVSSLDTIGADLPVSFWFSPAEVIELGAADAFDRSIFLCSLLIALGSNAKVHVLEAQGSMRHPVVITALDKCHVFDTFPPASHVTGATQKEALANFTLVGKPYHKSLFEFDQFTYDEFE